MTSLLANKDSIGQLNESGTKDNSNVEASESTTSDMKRKSKKSAQDGHDGPNPPKKQRGPKKPRDLNAPKVPLSGYVRFLTTNRERIRQANADKPFAEVTKLLAQEWTGLSPDEKKKYLDEAEKDKERYTRELEEYQKTEAYRLFQEKRRKAKAEKAGEEPDKKKGPGRPRNQPVEEESDTTERRQYDPSAPTYDIPIFTEEFLNHNKQREQELRALRKMNSELEEQNAILSKHIESMKQATDRLEQDQVQGKTACQSLSQYLHQLKLSIVTAFGGIAVPGSSEKPNMDNVEEYLKKMHEKLADKKDAKSEHLFERIQNIVNSMNLNL